MITVKTNNVRLFMITLFVAVFGMNSLTNAQLPLTNLNLNTQIYDISNFTESRNSLNLEILKPQSVTITSPSTNMPISAATDYDQTEEKFYQYVTLTGIAVAGNGSPMSGSSLQWKTSRSDLQPSILGTGQTLRIKLYSNSCQGSEHTITLSATGILGSTISTTRKITLYPIC